MKKSLQEQHVRNTMTFVRQLHQSGYAPSTVAEYADAFARKHGVKFTVDVTPTKITAVFHEPINQVVMESISPPSVNLRQLVTTIRQFKNTRKGDLSQVNALSYPNWVICFANLLLPPCYLLLIGSSYESAFLSILFGFIAWLGMHLLRNERAPLIELLTAFLSSFIIGLVSHYNQELPVLALCISATLLFVPGLTVTNSLASLAINDYRSGLELMAQSGLIIIKLVIGIVLGLGAAELILPVGETVQVNHTHSLWIQVPALLLISMAIGLVFNGGFRTILLGLPAAGIGLWGPQLFTPDWLIGTWISTVLIILYGIAVSKITHLPPFTYIVQGFIIIVPGTRIMVGASDGLYSTSILGTPNVGLNAVLMFAAIVAGQITTFALMNKHFKVSAYN